MWENKHDSVVISIHVTAKVTTRRLLPVFGSGTDFNPRHREGDDYRKLWSIFQHRNFNPRHREGDDPKGALDSLISMISIHVTAKVTTIGRRQ